MCRVNPFITCTDGRWVAALLLRCFQHPATPANGWEKQGGLQFTARARHPVKVMWVLKESITNTAGTEEKIISFALQL